MKSSQGTLILFIVIGIFGPVVQSRLPQFPERLSKLPHYSHYLNFTDEDRIVGGEEAREGQFKYQVSLQRRSSSGSYTHYCGASVLSSNHIITAAHCVSGRRAESISVLVGTIHVSGSQSRGQRHEVSKVIAHEGYESSTVNNDIAILVLKNPLTLSDKVQPIAIPEFNTEFLEKTSCIVTGWGTEEEGGRVSRVLRHVTVPLVDKTTCQKEYGSQDITDSMICAGVEEGGKDSCQGDSGGPLVYDGFLVGIVSWGYGCARPGYPGVYTKVSHFTSWITERAAANVLAFSTHMHTSG